MENFTLKLLVPVQLGEVDYTELTLREPTAGELESAVSANNMTTAIKIIAIVSVVPVAVIRLLAQRDFMAANEYIGRFTGGGQGTTQT